MGKQKVPTAPNMKPLMEAAIRQQERSNKQSDEALAWAKERYAQDKIISDQIVNDALERSRQADEWARQDRERYSSVFQPMEDSLVAEAKDYASPERMEAEAGKAAAGVAESFEANRRAAAQNLESYGVDPSSTRFAALDAGSRLAQAAAAAGAANKARTDTEQVARDLRAQAIQVGQQYPGQAIADSSVGIQAGNSGINSQLATTGSGASSMGTGPQWSQLAAQALGAQGDIMNNAYANQMAQYNAGQQQSSGIGSMLGTIAGAALPLIFEEGGAIPATASPTAGKAIDDVPAQLTVGEFVVPKDVMEWKGEEFFQKLIEQSRKAKPQAPAQPEMGAVPTGPPTFVSRPQAIPAGA